AAARLGFVMSPHSTQEWASLRPLLGLKGSPRDAALPRSPMPELLLELFSEEIPARMQVRAAEELKRLVTGELQAQGLETGEAQAFATPRRLALVVRDVAARSPDQLEERKGPRVNAPEAAIQGFLKAAGLSSIGQASVVSDPKKGDYYVARI